MRDFPRAPKTDPDSDFREPAISTLPAWTAGTSANISVETRQTPALNTSTRQSISPFRFATMPAGAGKKTTSKLRHQYATASPPTTAMDDKIRPSVSSCCSKRPWRAPTARRMVISCWRANERTMSRLLTLEHAMRSTTNTTASVILRIGSISAAPLNGAFQSGINLMSWPRLVAGYSASNRFATVEICSCACSMVTPSLRRAKPSIQRALRSSSLYPPGSKVSCIDTGTQNWIGQPTNVP